MIDPLTELANPSTAPERLAQLAAERPDLAAQISAHPNAYPELQAWLAQYAQAQQMQQAQQAQQAQAQAQQAIQMQQMQQAQQQVPQAGMGSFSAPLAQTGGFAQFRQFPGNAPAQQRPRSKRTLWIVLASVLALVLAVGGGIWWFIAGKVGGAPTSEAAAVKLVEGIANQDLLSLYGSFAPSEFASFEEPLKRISSAGNKDTNTSIDQTLTELRSSVSIQVDGLETRSSSLAEGVERVIFTDGTITFDGDAAAIASAVAQLALASTPDLSDSDIEDIEYEIESGLELPYTLDFAEIRQEAQEYGNFEGVSLVSVQEPGGWYISPLMTGADYIYLESSRYSDYRLGDEVISAEPSATPEAAAAAIVDAIMAPSQNMFTEIAPHLPLPERRLVSIYGQGLFDSSMMSNPDHNFEVLEQRYSSAQNGGQARLKIEELSIGSESTSHGFNLYNGITISGLCAELSNQYAYDDSDSYYYEEWKVEESNESVCLTDIPLAQELGLNELSIIAVKEGGGWFISPIATVADAASIVSTRVAELSESGELSELLRGEDIYF